MSPSTRTVIRRRNAATSPHYVAGYPSAPGPIPAGRHPQPGEGAYLFRSTALRLHGLGDEVLPIEVLTATHDQPRSRPWARFCRSDLRSRLLETRAQPRVGLEDTLIDVSDKSGELEAISPITRALQERRTTVARVRAVIDQRRRVRHRALIEHVLDDASGVESVLERLYADNVELRHGIEPMTRQFVVPHSGHRADGAYIERRTLIELDGAAYHSVEADRTLDNRHASLGWGARRGAEPRPRSIPGRGRCVRAGRG